MTITVLPTAIEWIGRDRLGFSAMYYLLQNIPSLLDYGTANDVVLALARLLVVVYYSITWITQ